MYLANLTWLQIISYEILRSSQTSGRNHQHIHLHFLLLSQLSFSKQNLVNLQDILMKEKVREMLLVEQEIPSIIHSNLKLCLEMDGMGWDEQNYHTIVVISYDGVEESFYSIV